MSVKIFLSTVSDEFRRYRDVLRSDLTRHNVEVKVQEDFTDLGGETLDKLGVYIAHCDAVVHLVGDMTGAYPGERGLSALLAKYPDLPAKLLPLGAALKDGSGLSYTQWEAWLALYHRKLLLIAEAEEAAERERQYAPTDASRTAQDVHLARLSACLKSPRRPITDRNGPLLDPTPAVQLWRREPPNLPLNQRSGDATDRRYLLPAECGLFPAQELAGWQLRFTALAVACRTAALDVRRTSTRAEASEWSIAIISIEMPGMSEVIARAGARLRLAQAQGAAPPP